MIPEEKMRMALLVAYGPSIPMILIKKERQNSPSRTGIVIQGMTLQQSSEIFSPYPWNIPQTLNQ